MKNNVGETDKNKKFYNIKYTQPSKKEKKTIYPHGLFVKFYS